MVTIGVATAKIIAAPGGRLATGPATTSQPAAHQGLANGDASVFGNYVLFDRVGDGGFAEVFLASEIGDDSEPSLVIKRLHEHLEQHSESIDMFVTEARLMAALDHPGIVRVHYLERIAERWSMVMERVDCDSLGEIFDFALRIRQNIPMEAGVHIAAQVARALEYAHGRADGKTGESLGIVHRDVKPDNVLLSWAGEVKITDFGCAKATIRQELTRPGVRKGTLDYMSPEQCLGKSVDIRSDVFSLGVCLYELVTYKRLYGDRNDARVMERIAHEVTRPPSWENSAVNASLDLIVLRALEKVPNDRFDSAGDMARALEWWLERYATSDPVEQLTDWLEAHYRPHFLRSPRFAQVSRLDSSSGQIQIRPHSRQTEVASAGGVTAPHSVVSRARSKRTTRRSHTSAPSAVSRARTSAAEQVVLPPGTEQVLTEDRFRALQSIIARHSNLPPTFDQIFGRDGELEKVDRIFSRGMQLVSVHGPAGVGKTTVAMAYGRQRLEKDRPPGGVWLCDASRDERDSEICRSVAEVLGLPSKAAQQSREVEQIGEALEARGAILLIIDGLDVARSSIDRVLESWIKQAPDLEIVVTSRVALGSMKAETVGLRGIALPDGPDDAAESPAIQLVVARVQERRPNFEFSAQNAAVLIEMVRSLSGNPQAIEIAAARLAESGDAGDLRGLTKLTGKSRDATALGRETLSAAVRWSWQRLGESERAAFAISSVFHGGFTSDAAVAVMGDAVGAKAQVFEVLASLRQRSLLQAYEPGEHPGHLRYRVVRIATGFARERLIDRRDAGMVMRRHADYHLALADRVAEECFKAGGIEFFRDLRLELPNLTAIQHRALRVRPPTVKSATRALRASLALEPVAVLRSRYDEHAKLLDKAIRAAERLDVDPSLLASALVARVRASLALGGTRDDKRLLDAAGMLADTDGDVRLVGHVETARGEWHQHVREYAKARDCYRRAVHLLNHTNARRQLGVAYIGLGKTSQLHHRLETAESCLQTAQKLLRDAGFQHTEAVATAALGRVRLDLDYPAKAGDDLRWAKRVFRAFNDKRREAVVLLDLGRLQRDEGEFGDAARCFNEALAIARHIGDDGLETKAREQYDAVRA